MAGVHVFSARKMAEIKAEIDEVTASWLPRAIAISDINFNTANLRIIQLQYAFVTNAARKQKLAITMISLLDEINENRDTYELLKASSEKRKLYSENERKLYSEFDQEWDHYQDLSLTIFQLIRDSEHEAAVALLNGEAQDVFNDLSADLAQLVAVNKQDSYQAAARAELTFESTHRISTLLMVGTILLSIFIAGWLVRQITVPIQELESAAREVADGDLDTRLAILSKDEIGNLSQSFNKMTAALQAAKARTESQADKLRAQNKELAQTLKELRETQEQLLLKEKMASLGDLVAGVAHEINNPIGTVNSSADVSNRCLDRIEIVLDKSESIEDIKNDENLPKALRILKDNIRVTLVAGDRIATIIKSLKNFARLDESEYQKADLHEGLDSTLTLLGTEFKGRITVNKQYGDIPKIICNPGQLNQVFLSLLKNASAAVEGRGQIEIKTQRENGRIHIEITDNGRGIPEENLSRLFEFGFSAAGGRVKMASGLSTAYNIIQKHDGEIKVESEVGKGSTFSILLPIK